MSDPHGLVNEILHWRTETQMRFQDNGLILDLNTVIAGVLCFVAASISSAGGWCFFPFLAFLVSIFLISLRCRRNPSILMSDPHGLVNEILHWRTETQMRFQDNGLILDLNTVIAGVLCFVAASISSAGGVGGGALFLPILTIIAGFDLKKASTFSAFMVTGGSAANVIYNMWWFTRSSRSSGGQGGRRRSVIDYDMALLSEPCMLLGVSLGVISNVMFPEWLVMILFLLLLATSTYKTCSAGLTCWRFESLMEVRAEQNRRKSMDGEKEEEKVPLLDGGEGEEGNLEIPKKKLVFLVLIWISFFLIQSIKGDKDGKIWMRIKPCSTWYWIITLSQVPVTIFFTAFILYDRRKRPDCDSDTLEEDVKGGRPPSEETKISMVIFPLAALLSGVLGGLFGIGGGLLINPVLLQIGVPPQIAAGTCTFMVLFSSSMSSIQYVMLGMDNIDEALGLATGCFLASLIGIVLVQRAVTIYGRTSLIIFCVSIVVALSTVSFTCFGALDVWSEYNNGEYMGFKLPC